MHAYTAMVILYDVLYIIIVNSLNILYIPNGKFI